MEEFTIRRMRREDIEDVIGLERRVFDNPWTRGLFKSELAFGRRSVYLVADTGSRILGFIGARLHGHEMHITNMAVEREFRRRGIGSLLLLECVRNTSERSVQCATLEVRSSNDIARQFYRRKGFTELGLRRGYYQDTDEDAIMMSTTVVEILGEDRGREE